MLRPIRRSTERPEALRDFATLVRPGPEIGAYAARLLADPAALSARLAELSSPFGDGKAAERVHVLTRVFVKPISPRSSAS